jgi:hypothetical protein
LGGDKRAKGQKKEKSRRAMKEDEMQSICVKNTIAHIVPLL